MQVSGAPARAAAAARAPWRVPARGCGMGWGARLASSSSSFRPATETGRRHRRSEQRAPGGASRRRRQQGVAASRRPGRDEGEDTETVSEPPRPAASARAPRPPASVGWAGVDLREGSTQRRLTAAGGRRTSARRPGRSINLSPALTLRPARRPPIRAGPRPSPAFHWLQARVRRTPPASRRARCSRPRTSSRLPSAQGKASSASAACASVRPGRPHAPSSLPRFTVSWRPIETSGSASSLSPAFQSTPPLTSP